MTLPSTPLPDDLNGPMPRSNLNCPSPDDSPSGSLLSPSEVDTLPVVAEDLAAFPDRRKVMAARVAEDLSRLAMAAEAGPEALRTTMHRWPFDDGIGFPTTRSSWRITGARPSRPRSARPPERSCGGPRRRSALSVTLSGSGAGWPIRTTRSRRDDRPSGRPQPPPTRLHASALGRTQRAPDFDSGALSCDTPHCTGR